MAHSYTYQSFCDYTVLPELREACANGATEFELTTLPPLHLDAIVEQANRAPDHVHKEVRCEVESKSCPFSHTARSTNLPCK